VSVIGVGGGAWRVLVIGRGIRVVRRRLTAPLKIITHTTRPKSKQRNQRASHTHARFCRAWQQQHEIGVVDPGIQTPPSPRLCTHHPSQARQGAAGG
jgi:hypothetical protein